MHRPPFLLSRLCLLVGLALASGASSAASPASPEPPGAVRDTIARDNLWNIARDLQADPGVTRQQWMVAIQRLNPPAFEGGNMHRLRRNVPLTLPSRQQAAAEDAAQARALVAQHRAALTQGIADLLPAPQTAAQAPATPPSASAPVATAPDTAATQAATAPSAPAPTPSSAEVISAPPATSDAPKDQGNGSSLWWPAAAGLALAGAAFWIWRRPRPQADSTDEATDTSAPSTFLDQDGVPRRRKARVVEVSQAAADMARTVEALGPVVQLVRRDGEPTAGGLATAASPNWVQAYRDLQVDLATAQAEIGRDPDAQVSLERVRRFGTAAQQREADALGLTLA